MVMATWMLFEKRLKHLMSDNQRVPLIDLNRLFFRRQFILGPKSFCPNEYWETYALNNQLFLSIHQDLPRVINRNGNKLIVFIGLGIDPYQPGYDEQDIATGLLEKGASLKSLIEATTPIAGRWLIIFQDNDETYIFSDPCGFRQVYYYSDGNQTWCASQPEVIKANCYLSFTSDIHFLEFLKSIEYAQQESALIGTKTIYQDCYHLLPNHYLDLKKHQQVRFYPASPISPKDTSEIVDKASRILKGIFDSLTNRYNVSLALTAGWDSRLLLAASRNVFAKISYFIDRKGILPENHPDIRISRKLSEQFRLEFELKNSYIPPPGWFISILSNNITCVRVLPKTNMIYARYQEQKPAVYLNGNCGEIFRNYYDKRCRYDANTLDAEQLLQLMGYRKRYKYLVQEITNWRIELDPQKLQAWNILDLLYWEQRLGNWGAQFPAEEDIAVEELSPLNCRLLLEILLSSPRETRAAPDYELNRLLIRNLLPDALDHSFNPPKKPNSIILMQRIIRYLARKIIKNGS